MCLEYDVDIPTLFPAKRERKNYFIDIYLN